MEAMEKRFGKRPTSDKLQQEFFQLQQEKGEQTQHFTGCLENSFKRYFLITIKKINSRNACSTE